MAESARPSSSNPTVTVLDTVDSSASQEVPVTLKLNKRKRDKKVNWSEGTIDNEHMNKKKSKCCCIYRKPHTPDESSSDDDNLDCEDCRGHVENKHEKPPDLCPATAAPPPTTS